MARIVTVYTPSKEPWEPREMGYIRWLKISEALSRLGHQVDIATNENNWKAGATPVPMSANLRRVPLEGLDWRRYDVVKTLFHLGFDVLETYGGRRHPFIISKLGSVVGPEDMPGIYFLGPIREALYATQQKIHTTSRYVTVLSPAARDLWTKVHGARRGMLLVPGAVSSEIPEPGPNPYVALAGKVCLFSGNIYSVESQPDANVTLVNKLNLLGRYLQGSGVRLCFQGTGDTEKLDPELVTNLGSCAYEASWNYMQHAAVGVVVSAGPFMHNNESTKIYHYLRAGLPVVNESGFPNDWVVRDSGLGFVVPAEDMKSLAEHVIRAAEMEWNRSTAVEFALKNHTWDARARVYAEVIPHDSRTSLLYRMTGRRLPTSYAI